jgi:hypothetical protein
MRTVDDPPLCPMPKPTSTRGCGGGPSGTYSGTKTMGVFTVKVILDITRTHARTGSVDVSISMSLFSDLVCKAIPWTYDADRADLVLSENACYSDTIDERISDAEFKYDFREDVIHLRTKVNGLGKAVTIALPGPKKCAAD